MKLTWILWTVAAAAAVTMQLLSAASLGMEEKELEDALATREVQGQAVKDGRRWHVKQQIMLLNALGNNFQTVLRFAKRLARKGKGGGGKGRKIKEHAAKEHAAMPFKNQKEEKEDQPDDKQKQKEKEEKQPYDEMPFKRNQEEKRWTYDYVPPEENQKEEEKQLYEEMPFKRFLEGPGGDAKESVSEQDAVALCRDFLNSHQIGEAAGKGKQEEIQEEGKQDESQEEMALKDLVQTQKMLEFCLELIP